MTVPASITIALPSGVGVAMSTINHNTNSLVGVAISASLLPPAVNCGINWIYALVGEKFTGKVIIAGVLCFVFTILCT